MIEQKKHLNTITHCYVIGTILVIFGHSHPLGNTYYPDWLKQTIDFIYTFHMPLFFFISGFLLQHTRGGYRDYKINFEYWIKKKAIALLVPYVVLSLIGIVPKFILSTHGDTTDQMQMTIPYFLKMIFAPRSGVWGHMWFIPTLFILYLLGTLYLAISQRNKALTELIFILAGVLSVFPVGTTWFCIRDLCIYSIFLLLGIESRRLLLSNYEKVFKKRQLFVSLVVAMMLFAIAEKIESNGLHNALYRIIAICMIYVVFYIGFHLKKQAGHFVHVISDNMLSIYLYSWPFQASMELIINKKAHAPWPVIFSCMFLIGLCGPLVLIGVYKAITKGKNNSLTRVLNPILGIR